MYFSPGGEFFKNKKHRMVLWALLAVLLVPSATAMSSPEGTECWGGCGATDGPCTTGFCGENGHCCRVGYPGCGAEGGCENFHCCVKMPPTVPSVNIVDENMYQQDGSEAPSESVDQNVEVDAEGNIHPSTGMPASGLLATITVQVTKVEHHGTPVVSRTN